VSFVLLIRVLWLSVDSNLVAYICILPESSASVGLVITEPYYESYRRICSGLARTHSLSFTPHIIMPPPRAARSLVDS